MRNIRKFKLLPIMLCAAFAASPMIFAQQVISARAGLVNYINGQVSIDGVRAEVGSTGILPQIETGQTLAVENGTAEVLLTPGSFARLAPLSSIRMLDDRLASTRIAVTRGEALLEIAEIYDDNSVTVSVGGGEIRLLKKGLYYFNADQAVVRVFDGKVLARYDDTEVELKKGRFVQLAPTMAAAKFSTKDAKKTWLYDFSANRSELLAYANQIAIQTNRNSLTTSSWVWVPWTNGWMGGFSYIPASGWLRSPFGTSYYNQAGWRSIQILNSYNRASGGMNTGAAWGGMNSPRSAGVSSGSSSGASSGAVAVRSAAPASAPSNTSRGRSR